MMTTMIYDDDDDDDDDDGDDSMMMIMMMMMMMMMAGAYMVVGAFGPLHSGGKSPKPNRACGDSTPREARTVPAESATCMV